MRALPTLRRLRHRRRSRGQSIVEFALILPIFLVFVAAALDLGRVFYANITLNNAAREGAFLAAKSPELYLEDQPCNQATNRIVCRIQNESTGSMVSIAPTDIDLTCSVAGCAKAAGSTVSVEVRGSFRLITPLLSFVFGGQNLQLTSSATAQVEYLPDPDTLTMPPGPIAEFSGSPRTGPAGTTVDFDSSASTGDPTGFQWDFTGDGVVDSTETNPSHTYDTDGTYTVSLTVVNLSGANTRLKTGYVVIGTGVLPTEDPGATPTCAYPPNVIGMLPSAADIALADAGFLDVLTYDDLTSGPKNKIQAQDPDHTQCIALSTQIRIHYRPN
jgi:Flp pilus assembly protein TadG